MSKGLTEFGQELDRLLRERDWSQSELARRTDLDVSTISRAMRGLQPPSHETVEKVADALRVDVAWLKRLAGLRVVMAPRSERDPTVEYIAQRLEALPPAVREEAVDALGAQLDTIYKVAGIEKERGVELHHWRGISFEEAEAQGKEAMLEWARANRKRFMEIVAELGLDVPHTPTDDDTSAPPQRRTGT